MLPISQQAITAIALLSWLLLSVLGPTVQPPLPSSGPNGTYDEDFQSYAYKDTSTTADWNTYEGQLNLPLKDSIEQTDPVAACDRHGNTVLAWRTGTTIYARRVDARGNPLWYADVQVNVTGVATSGPDVAIDSAGNALVVWYDERNGDWDVYAQKLNSGGGRLWAADKLISVGNSTAPYYPVETAPSIATDGDSVFVVWFDYRADWDIFAQKLDAAGNREWPEDLRVNADDANNKRWSHADASNGRLTVVWAQKPDDYAPAAYLFAQQLDYQGTRLWANDVQVSNQHPASVDNRVAATQGSNSVVAWAYRDVIYMQRLTSTGDRAWPSDVVLSAASSRVPGLVGLEGGSSIVSWRDSEGQVKALRFSADGSPEWTTPLTVSPANAAVYYYGTDMESDSNGDMSVTWIDQRNGDNDVYLERFTVNGQLLWNNNQRVNSPLGVAAQKGPAIAAGSGFRLVTWVDSRAQGDVYAQKIGDDGLPQWGQGLRVNLTAGFVQSAGTAVALTSDSGSVVIWTDTRNRAQDIYAQRLDLNGNRIWAEDVRVNRHPGLLALRPYVAVTRTGDIIVSWWESSSIKVQRLGSNGEPRWNSEIVAATAGSDYDMAIDGDGNCLITWWEYRHGNWPEPPDIFVQRVNSIGGIDWGSGGIEVNQNGTGWHLYPSIVVDQSNSIWIAWTDADRTDGDIFLQRLDSSGAAQWANDKQVSTDTSNKRQTNPIITIDATGNAVVAWLDYRNDRFDYRKSDIYAQQVSPTGQRLWANDVLVNELSGSPVMQLSVSSGVGVSLAWVDLRNGNPDIFAQHLSPSGARLWNADVNINRSDRFFLVTASAQSSTISGPGVNVVRALATTDLQLNGGNLELYLTNNGGRDWFEVTSGAMHQFVTEGSDLQWRIILTAESSQVRSPVVRSLRIEYSTQADQSDLYEPDDSCAQAQPISITGTPQARAFLQAADVDWAWFDALGGKTYVIQTDNLQTNADTMLALYGDCQQPPLATDDNAFGPGAQITWQAPTSQRVYLKVNNHDLSIYGENTGYELSVRLTSQPPVAIIVAGHNDFYDLQANIDFSADAAYRTLLDSGVPKSNIRYFSPNPQRDVDNNGLNDDIVGLPRPADVRDTIQDWTRSRGVSPGVPLHVYLVDHGNSDQFLAQGIDGKITASDLNLWLSNLEDTSGADNINVILEACRSGSFIDATAVGPSYISGRNRVVIASTSSQLNAYASPQGALFSDVFWTALGQNQNLLGAFRNAKQAVQTTGLGQEPWLDDNGDAVADDLDGALASSRGLGATFAGAPPVIDWLRVSPVSFGRAIIQVRARDDLEEVDVRVVIYPPDFVEPPPAPNGTTPVLDVPSVDLVAVGGNLYRAGFDDFTQAGTYRLVAYAQDSDGNQALPVNISLQSNNDGWVQFLPLILR